MVSGTVVLGLSVPLRLERPREARIVIFVSEADRHLDLRHGDIAFHEGRPDLR